jgi:hypothetical protein
VKFGVIVDVEATRAIRQAEVGAAKTMIDRTEQRLGLKPQRLAADARTVGVSSIRASSIRAMAIMTNAVETNRILDSPLSCCVTPPFPHELY